MSGHFFCARGRDTMTYYVIVCDTMSYYDIGCDGMSSICFIIFVIRRMKYASHISSDRIQSRVSAPPNAKALTPPPLYMRLAEPLSRAKRIACIFASKRIQANPKPKGLTPPTLYVQLRRAIALHTVASVAGMRTPMLKH